MNNTVDLNRFGMLFKKHTVEHFRFYAMSLVVLGGVMMLVFSFDAAARGNYELSRGDQMGFFFLFLLLGGSIFASTVFSDLGEKRRAIQSLMLPASAIEKYLVGWIYTVVIYPLLCISCFYVIDCFFVFVVNGKSDAELVNVFSTNNDSHVLFGIYGLLNSLSLFGAVFFEKLHFVKTAFLFFVALAVTIFINKALLQMLIPEETRAMLPFAQVGLGKRGMAYAEILLPFGVQEIYVSVVLISTMLLFWLAAYFRLREKQI